MKRVPLTLTCESCGARIPAISEDGIYKCEYCKNSFRLEKNSSPESGKNKDISTEYPEYKSQNTRIGFFIMIGIFSVVGISSALTFFLSSTSEDIEISSGPNIPVLSDLKKKAVQSERVIWDKVGGPPITVVIEGREHILGRMRDLNKDGQLSIRVFDSESLEERWRTPDMGTYSSSYQAVRFAVSGNKLVVSDGRNVLHVHDIKDGREITTHPLTDRVEQICPLPDNGKVWVEIIDKRHIVFDLNTFSGTESHDRPANCPRVVFRERPDARNLRNIPRVDGLNPKRVFTENDFGIIYGARHPGTPIPVAAAFRPSNKEILWTKPVIQVDSTSYRSSFENFYAGLASGRFVCVYGFGSKGWQLTALDAETGDPLWSIELRKLFSVDRINNFILTDNYVYIVRTNSLEVFHAENGKLIGSLGAATYE